MGILKAYVAHKVAAFSFIYMPNSVLEWYSVMKQGKILKVGFRYSIVLCKGQCFHWSYILNYAEGNANLMES